MKTTPKQQAFIQGKAAGLSHRDAMIGAGYSPATADQAATTLMRKPGIKEAIAKARRELSKGNKTERAQIETQVLGKPKQEQAMQRKAYTDPKDFLHDAMNNELLPVAMRVDAAFKLMPYTHARIGEAGKKEKAKDRAKEITRGRFAPKEAPKLHLVAK